jgi:hypothetical protein
MPMSHPPHLVMSDWSLGFPPCIMMINADLGCPHRATRPHHSPPFAKDLYTSSQVGTRDFTLEAVHLAYQCSCEARSRATILVST